MSPIQVRAFLTLLEAVSAVRSLLILILGAILFRMVTRLLSTVQGALPHDDDKPHEASLDKDKIIDAEFEDVAQTESDTNNAGKP